MPVFANDDLGNAGLFALFLIIIIVSIDKHHQVCILLNGAGFSQVCQAGAFVITVFQSTVELGEGNDGDFHVFGQDFEGAGDF